MRHVVVFGAITAGMGCVASAAELGLASFYGHQRPGDLTAAHRNLPFGSQVKIVNLDNGRAAVVRIVDRGPFIRGRIIDVSNAAAETLGFHDAGLAHVRIDLVASAAPQNGSGRERPTIAALTASTYEICRYDAERVERLQGHIAGQPARHPAECENMRSRFVALAPSSGEFAPLVARGGAFFTEIEAAARIPVNAVAAVAERAAGSGRPADGCRAQAGSAGGAECEALRLQLLAFSRKARGFVPLAGRERALLGQTEAAARIPVTALAEAPERSPPPTRAAGGCGARASCEKTAEGPTRSLFDRLLHLFD